MANEKLTRTEIVNLFDGVEVRRVEDKLNINGLDEITNTVGTRREIYNLISKHNPLAIVDYREARVKIENDNYLIILKKTEGAYKINIIWRLTDNKHFKF